MQVQLLAMTPDPLGLIARAYGICTGKASIPLDNIAALIQKGHLSPIEHASATFEISGISRACSHQLVRHRLASYSQESQRYVQMIDAKFVVPETIRSNERALAIYRSALNTIRTSYALLLQSNVPKEDARFFLPNSTETRLIMTANFREWRHIIQLRSSPAAQWEIRALAHQVWTILAQKCPEIFEDLSPGMG